MESLTKKEFAEVQIIKAPEKNTTIYEIWITIYKMHLDRKRETECTKINEN